MKTIGLISRCDKKDVINHIKKILKHIKKKAHVLVDTNTASKLNLKGIPISCMREKGAEFIISIGGDGTVLRGIQKMKDPLPIIGINMGNLGFLTDVSPEDSFKVIDRLLLGFEIEERARLSVNINGKEIICATNEVVIATPNTAKILSLKIFVDRDLLEDVRADGVIFATPTGSTAYSMSAGGPILDPRVDGTVIVPVAPFKLSSRPWVVPAKSIIQVKITSQKKEGVIVVDGQNLCKLKKQDKMIITKAKIPARFVKIKHNCFYDKVKSKLS